MGHRSALLLLCMLMLTAGCAAPIGGSAEGGAPAPDRFDGAPPDDGDQPPADDVAAPTTGAHRPDHMQRPLSAVYRQLGPTHQVSEMGLHVHDPSRIHRIGGRLTIAVTGKENADGYMCGLETWRYDVDDDAWRPGQCLLMDKPGWVGEQVPGNGGAYWAPAVASERRMYYAVSSGFDDGQAHAIGMVEAEGPRSDLTWRDAGPILESVGAEANDQPEPAAIDPAVFTDDDGRQYLVYGGGHIWMTELDPATGVPLAAAGWEADGPAFHHLANGPQVDAAGTDVSADEELWVEAPFLYRHEDHYYLFVNWYACCDGVDSTYEIRVGRSASPTGPFLDRDGVDMRDGGGTMLLDRDGVILGDPRYIGPGHAGVYEHTDGGLALSFHYYDATDDGTPKIGMAELRFTDGWPHIVESGVDLNE